MEKLLVAARAMAVKCDPLALPAPAVTVAIPGMNAIPALSPLPVSGQATIPPLAAKSIAA